MKKLQVVAQLKQLIEEQNETSIESTTQHLDIDSFTMMLIITFVDEELSVRLDLDALDFDVFYSLDTLADLIMNEAAKTAAE